jgi:hypothetical protein
VSSTDWLACPAPCLLFCLQALDSGHLQDSMGKRCDFRNAVLVLTTSPTNAPLPPSWAATQAAAAAVGPAPAADGSIGSISGSGSNGGDTVLAPEGHIHPEAFAGGDSSKSGSGSHNAHSAAAQSLEPDAVAGPSAGQQQQRQQQAVHPLRQLPAELLSRLDVALSMQPLGPADMVRVVEMQLAEFGAALAAQGIQLQVDPAAQHWLAAHGMSPVSGAQRLQSLLREQLLLPVADALLRARVGEAEGAAGAGALLAVTARLAADGVGLTVSLD